MAACAFEQSWGEGLPCPSHLPGGIAAGELPALHCGLGQDSQTIESWERPLRLSDYPFVPQVKTGTQGLG